MHAKYKQVTISLAKQAGQIMHTNFMAGIKKEHKDDDTFITIADKQINDLVIKTIKKEFPDHSVLSEEGNNLQDSQYVWVCDPIDGTAPFSHGLPISVFSLALTHNGQSILGVINDPFMKRLLVAEKDSGAYLNGQKVSVSTAREFTRTMIDIESWHGFPYDLNPLKQELVNRKSYAVSLGCTGYGGMLVAIGEFAAAVFSKDTPWDAAALKIIIEEAGGKFTDLFGQEQNYHQPIKGFIASNGLIHDQLAQLVKQHLTA